MSRLEVQIDGNASGLERSLNKGSNSLNKFSNEANKVANRTDGFTRSVGNANGVTMEFNRVIQDAPYGMMGIGNNITQLTDSFARLKQQTGSTGAALRQTFTSLLSSGNLLSLGISAVVTGWTLWERHAQKANKATKDLEDGTKSYIETLEGLKRASADGQVEANKELTKLKLMYDATQNLTIPMKDRKRVADELIKQYPKQFEGLTTEALLAGKASEAYNQLTASITATAMAAAYAAKISENASRILNNQLQANKLGAEDLVKATQDLEKARQIQANSGSSQYGSNVFTDTEVLRAEAKVQEIISKISNLNKDNSKAIKESTQLQNLYNNQIGAGADASGKLGTKLEGAKTATKETKDVMEGLIKSSLSQYDQRISEINSKYTEIFKQIQKIGDAGKQKDAFGLATQLKQFETLKANVDRYLDAMKGVKAIGLTSPTGAVSALPSIPQSEIDRLNKPTKSGKSKDEEKQAEKLSRIVERGFRQGINGVLDNIDDLGSNFYDVFSNVFMRLSSTVTDTMSSVLTTQLGNMVSKSWDSDDFQIGKISNDVSKGIVAGAGLAGKALGSMFKQSSGIGQAAGGGISGAASGFAIASSISKSAGPWGAAIGGVLGIVSGIFSAETAKRQLKIQEQQLSEQRKQTAVLERQNSLAYASSVTGQQTLNGFVTGIDRNAKGELVAKVSGQDLMFILQKTGGMR